MTPDLTAFIQDLARQLSEIREEDTVNYLPAPVGLNTVCQALIYIQGRSLVPLDASDELRMAVGMMTTVCRCPRLTSKP